jgi:DNA-binding MarR family transcriptional regulator
MKGLTGKRVGADDSSPLEEGMLAEHVGFRVHIARRAVRRALRNRPESAKGESLPSGSVSVLELICHNPGIGSQTLSEILFLDPPKVTVILRHLAAAGLVDRIPSTVDGRKSELSLTAAGIERLEAARQFAEFQEKRIARGLSEEERAELNRLLRKLQDALR